VIITPNIRKLAIKVAEALENPDAWCTGEIAQDAAGHRVDSDDPSAVKWCALGYAVRLGGVEAAYMLYHFYNRNFHNFMNDNDVYGREFVRDRLLELANSYS
jgi:hypothetical protein